MKRKFIYLFCFIGFLFSVTGCGNKTEAAPPTPTPSLTPTPTPTPMIINDAEHVLSQITEINDKTLQKSQKKLETFGGYDFNIAFTLSEELKEFLNTDMSSFLFLLESDNTESVSREKAECSINDSFLASGEVYNDLANKQAIVQTSLVPDKIVAFPFGEIFTYEESIQEFIDSVSSNKDLMTKWNKFMDVVIDNIKASPDIKISSTIGNEDYSVSGTEYCLSIDANVLAEELKNELGFDLFTELNPYKNLEDLPTVPTPTPIFETQENKENIIEFETPYGTGTIIPADGVTVLPTEPTSVPEEENTDSTETSLETPQISTIPTVSVIPTEPPAEEGSDETEEDLGTYYFSYIKGPKDSFAFKISSSLADEDALYFVKTAKGGALFLDVLEIPDPTFDVLFDEEGNEIVPEPEIATYYFITFTKKDFTKGYSGVIRLHNETLEDIAIELSYSVKNDIYTIYYEPDDVTSYVLTIDMKDGFVGDFVYQEENSSMTTTFSYKDGFLDIGFTMIQDLELFFTLEIHGEERPVHQFTIPVANATSEVWEEEYLQGLEELFEKVLNQYFFLDKEEAIDIPSLSLVDTESTEEEPVDNVTELTTPE